jgi:hypothetical protein
MDGQNDELLLTNSKHKLHIYIDIYISFIPPFSHKNTQLCTSMKDISTLPRPN